MTAPRRGAAEGEQRVGVFLPLGWLFAQHDSVVSLQDARSMVQSTAPTQHPGSTPAFPFPQLSRFHSTPSIYPHTKLPVHQGRDKLAVFL